MKETTTNHFRIKLSERINSTGKFTIILEKSDTVGNEPALIIYLKFVIDLLKLDQKDAESVLKAIIFSLNEFRLKKQKILVDLIQVVSDGASVFVG